jgi:hypothetical protein
MWHQRLIHVHVPRLAGLHKYIDDIPAIKLPPNIERCDTCWMNKMHSAVRCMGDTREDATVPGQGISLDCGSIVQRSKDMTRFEKILGLDEETTHLLLADLKMDMLFGIATVGKSPPIAWLNLWLAQYRPSQVSFWCAFMDGGGELANNGDVQQLLGHPDYYIRPTAPASSFRNALGERPHKDVGAALQFML